MLGLKFSGTQKGLFEVREARGGGGRGRGRGRVEGWSGFLKRCEEIFGEI